jgi:predicted nucleic acid-binding protein
MVLVDTSVWIDHFRRASPRLAELLEQGEALCHPMVIGELACGNLPKRAETLELIHWLPRAPTATDDEALLLIDRHRLMGRGIGYIDVHLLASTMLSAETQLWTMDARLSSMAARLRIRFNQR